MSEDKLLNIVHLYWFVIRITIIPLKMHIYMDGITFSVIIILVHDDNNWANLLVYQRTNSIDG